jgi:hypothetical protein
VSLYTGSSASQSSGDIVVKVGSSSVDAGMISLVSGDGPAGGNILLSGGVGSSITGGSVETVTRSK